MGSLKWLDMAYYLSQTRNTAENKAYYLENTQKQACMSLYTLVTMA